MPNHEPTLADWKAALQSDRTLLAGLKAIAKSKGPDPMRQADIQATEKRILEAERVILQLTTGGTHA